MPTLDAWQGRLEEHFRELAASRSESGFPIFALEHGLSATEFEEIGDQLRGELAAGRRLFPHWLLWVVYATEQGYAYDGVEYWVSFEDKTPRWHDRASPRLLRSYFERFQGAFNGVTPSGPWAGHFSIITWPITHAILPVYLQLQFARALYDARLQFARLLNPSAAATGNLLARYAWDASSRFQEFLQQEELAGRIVLALLGQGAIKGQSPIYESTLNRIVTDLENVRSAGVWLKEARRVVSDRLRGVERGYYPAPAGQDLPSGRPATPASPPPNVRPALLLRRSAPANWSVVLEVPNFNGVGRLSPQLFQFLKTTRCTLAGMGGAMLPAGWTLYAQQMRVLRSWPPAGDIMIAFERKNPVLENILRGECSFPKGPVWVFRIGNDGLAREIAGKTVRAGHQYVVLSEQPLATTLTFASPASVECEGVHALTLALPDALESDETAELQRIGIQVARNIRLWPAGLYIRNWDGEGHGDFLSTERPCFGIVHDHAVDEFKLRLNHEPELTLDGARAGQPLFVRLPFLPPGRHVLSVRAKRIGLLPGAQALRDLEGHVDLKVRDPTPWKSGTTAHPGLAVSLDPPDPSLDAFWEGNVRLSVLGPEGHEVTCAITLTGRNEMVVLSQEIGRFELPILASNWTQRFKRFASDQTRAWTYVEASTGRFVIKGEELGEYALNLERDSKPVRWICRADSHATEVRLVDDTGQEPPAEPKFYAFGRPAHSVPLDNASAMKGTVAHEPGGLYCARQGDQQDSLVVSSSHAAANFHELVIEPQLSDAPQDMRALLALIELWHQARLAGPLADSRREHICRRLLTRFYDTLCGSRWGHAEDAFFRTPQGCDFRQLERAIEGPGAFAIVLRQSCTQMQLGTAAGAHWFADAAHRYDVCHDRTLSEFALRLASWPFALSTEFAARAEDIQRNGVLMRGARLAALHCIATDQDHPGAFLPRWRW